MKPQLNKDRKVYLIVSWNNCYEQVFLTKVSALGWLAQYQNSIPKSADRKYWNKYKIVEGIIKIK